MRMVTPVLTGPRTTRRIVPGKTLRALTFTMTPAGLAWN